MVADVAKERIIKGSQPAQPAHFVPPVQHPPSREPMPNAHDLHVPLHWMTYSHHDLYLMATTLLHLDTANEVSLAWGKLATSLESIGDELAKLTKLTTGSWEGDAADLARETSKDLVQWADSASKQAKAVQKCLDRHIHNAEWASHAMPAPSNKPMTNFGALTNWRLDDPFHPNPEPGVPTPVPAAGFAGGGFGAASQLIADDGPEREQRAQLHQRAAHVMHELQIRSAKVYDDVPRFDAHDPKKRAHHGHQGTGEDPQHHDQHRTHDDADTGQHDRPANHGRATAHTVHEPHPHLAGHPDDEVAGSTSAASAAVPGGDGGGFGSGALGGGLGAGSGSGSGSGAGSGMAAEPRSGAGPFGTPFGGGAVAAAGASGVRGGGGMPMTPMGGGRGAGEQSKDKDSAEYLLGDRSVFLPDGTYTPEVIGALPGEMDEDPRDR